MKIRPQEKSGHGIGLGMGGAWGMLRGNLRGGRVQEDVCFIGRSTLMPPSLNRREAIVPEKVEYA